VRVVGGGGGWGGGGGGGGGGVIALGPPFLPGLHIGNNADFSPTLPYWGFQVACPRSSSNFGACTLVKVVSFPEGKMVWWTAYSILVPHIGTLAGQSCYVAQVM